MANPTKRCQIHPDQSFQGTWLDYHNRGCRCPASREAARLRRKRHREGRIPRGRVGMVPCIGTIRRIKALQALGYSLRTIATELGMTEQGVRKIHYQRTVAQRTAVKIRELYDRWSMTPGPSNLARKYAQRRGYAAPLEWDDDEIDNPDAKPHRDRGIRGIDTVAIDRACVGIRTQLTSGERLVAIQKLETWGYNHKEIARRLHIAPRSVIRLIANDKERRAAVEAQP